MIKSCSFVWSDQLRRAPSIRLPKRLWPGLKQRNAASGAEHFEAIPGYGIRASVEGHEVLVGTQADGTA